MKQLMINRISFIVTVTIIIPAIFGCSSNKSIPTDMKDTALYQNIEKEAMTESGIVRLSKIEVYPQYINEYLKYAVEVGSISLLTEPGVLVMYAVADKAHPCNITILETYSSKDAYASHISSEHFQKYKQSTLHMIKSLELDNVQPLNPNNQLVNYIR